jgi:hypothetical protein
MNSNAKFDPHSLNQIFFGLVIIWFGLSIFLHKIDYLIYGDWIDYLLVGIGILFYLHVILYLLWTHDNHLLTGKLIAGTILIALGGRDIYGIHEWWPLILIAMGVIVILSNKKIEN